MMIQTDVLTYHKKLLAEAEKEKEDLKAKVEKWHNSSKNLGKLLNTQMSANDKFRLGYGDYRYDGILSYENEVLQSVFMNKESDLENQPLYDRFVTAEGMHVVPPPMTGNYMPSGPDIEIDYSQFTYGPKQSQTSESETQTSDFDTCESDCSVETHESLPEPTVNKPKVVSQPKVWSDAPIIEEYESDSEDEHVSLPTEEQETPSFANQQVKTPRETVKNQFTHSKNPKVDKKRLGYGFTTKACFVCGSLSHLIRDCDFHEKRMAKQVELNKKKGKDNVQRENKPVLEQCAKSESIRTNLFLEHTKLSAEISTLVLLGEKETAVKPSTGFVIGDTKKNIAEAGTKSPIQMDYPPRALQNKGIVDSGCSRHMTGNKAYLAEYQDFNGGLVAFRGVKLHNCPYGGLSFTDLTNTDQDDSEIPALEEIYDNPTDGIFTNFIYDNEDPQSAVQTRSKVTKSSDLCFKISEALADKVGLNANARRTAAIKIQIRGVFAEILKKFDFVSVKTASTPSETQKPLVKDEEASDVDVHLYRSMIGSLMYLTASRPDIMYLKGKPKLGLWYPRVSSFDLEAYLDSDYAGANLDRKSTKEVVNFLAGDLFLSNAKSRQLWLLLLQRQNMLLLQIVVGKHHFSRDAYEKKLIQVLKIHTDDNVADLLTKAFDVSSVQKNLDHSDDFQGVIWVLESHWEEL
ncbi:hypothetical protein Tco_0796253 [Tanacetum coccineum]